MKLAGAICICAVMSTFVGSPLPAQGDPTPSAENAHRFVIAILPDKFVGQSKGFGDFNKFQIGRVDSSACSTTVYFSADPSKYVIDWKRVSGVSHQYYGSGADNGTVVISAGISVVEPNGRTAFFDKIGFDTRSYGLMMRVEKAFEVLKKSCEPGGDLGF